MFYESEKILESLVKYIGKPNKTNCYLSYDQLKGMLEDHRVQVEFGKKCVFILNDKGNYIELMFFANQPQDLLEERDLLLDLLPSNKRIIISIICKGGKNVESQQLITNMGFTFHKKYLRKNLIKSSIDVEKLQNENVCFARMDDINKIQDLIIKTFDEVSDQIPDREELGQMISRRQILKYITEDGLAGFLINELQGKKSYLRMLCIDEDNRGKGIGRVLLRAYIKSEYENVNLFYLWVDENNKKAIELYSGQGYVSDGLEQYIYSLVRDNN